MACLWFYSNIEKLYSIWKLITQLLQQEQTKRRSIFSTYKGNIRSKYSIFCKIPTNKIDKVLQPALILYSIYITYFFEIIKVVSKIEYIGIW